MPNYTLSFDEFVGLMGAYWKVERLENLEFYHRIEPYPKIGADVFVTYQSGFRLCSLDAPRKPLLAICKILEGQLSVNIDGSTQHYTSTAEDTFLVCNGNNVRAEHRNLKLIFYPISRDLEFSNEKSLHYMLKSMIQDFGLGFEQIYKALHTYNGFGPLRAAAKNLHGGSTDLLIMCVMLKNFHDNNFQLKSIADETNLSISTISRHEIAGYKVKHWSNMFKINTWRHLKNQNSQNEIAQKLGFSSSEKLRDFLRKQGVL